MGKNRGSAPVPPPADSEDATSAEEEVNGGIGSDSESESESELEVSKQPPKKPAPVKKPAPDSSSDEDDSGSESDSGSPVTKPIENIKPIASKPVVTTAIASKANSSPLQTKTISAAGVKRPANSENSGGETGGGGERKDTKRLKKKPEKYVVESVKKPEKSVVESVKKPEKYDEESVKKPEKYVEESVKKGNSNDESRKLFQRLWSEDDEIAILRGMVDYSAKKNADPVANLDDFHEFIKKSIHIDVSRSQLQDKIRRLRKKYNNNAGKEKKGKEINFAKDHERKSFEWSKKVWGKENSTVEKKSEITYELKSTNVNTRKPKFEDQEVEVEGNNKEGKSEDTRLEEGVKLGNMGLRNSGIEEWIKENGQLIDEEKRAEMEKKWKDFKVVEGEFYAKKLELMLEETNLILDALKSSAS